MISGADARVISKHVRILQTMIFHFIWSKSFVKPQLRFGLSVPEKYMAYTVCPLHMAKSMRDIAMLPMDHIIVGTSMHGIETTAVRPACRCAGLAAPYTFRGSTAFCFTEQSQTMMCMSMSK